MSGYLLVPTNVQAFLVGGPGDRVYDLAPVPRTADDVKNWYVDSKHSFAFGNRRLDPLPSGIHLHWALPDALMHARHEADGTDPEQPCIPNRWLVVRMWHAASNSAISTKTWVVESDYASDADLSRGTPFFRPTLGRTVPPGGCSWPSDSSEEHGAAWRETHSSYRFELKSFGWGDPSFAAYYPACTGVLGFRDTMEGVASGDRLTYLVIGWYSDHDRDPLHPTNQPDTLERCQARVARLGWSCPDLPDSPLPDQTLCHGGVVGITWQGTDRAYPASVGSTTPTVAIGGSAAEALAALVAPGPESRPRQLVLCAFQHGQATQVSDDYQLGELLHRHGFSAAPGGTLWSIEPVRQAAAAQAAPPPMSAKVQGLLRELNQAQQARDRHMREIDSRRWQLFACWVTWAGKQTIFGGSPEQRDTVDPVAVKFQAATSRLQEDERKVTEARQRVTDALGPEHPGLQLAESTMPPFLYPKDPFVILNGANLIGIDRARPQRPDKAEDGALLLRCRLPSHVVTGVSQSGTIRQQWQAASCFRVNFPEAVAEPPDEIARALALETLLFDPNSAGLIDSTDRLLDRALLQALQRSLDASRRSPSNTNELAWQGRPPDPLGITAWAERNPWLPVYLMWQARWAPAYEPGPEPDHREALDGWQLDPHPLAGDLVPQQKSPARPTKDVLLEGATIISPLSGTQLAKSLREFAESAGRTADHLEPLAQTLVLGQSLGGFNDLLLRQTLGLCLPPVPPTSDSLAVDAAMWEAMGQVAAATMPGDADYFFPVRAGALQLVNLWVVDAFGQTRKLLDSGNASARKPHLIASAALPTPPDDYHASFSPRLVQPARLSFEWDRADAAAAGPVCGWIVANFLDKSFIVFGSSGAPIGTLESVLPALGKKTIESKVRFQWRPLPGSALTIGQIGNEPLRRFVELLHNFSADEGQAFLELVDLVLRKTDARLPPEDPAMAVLLGRPLALVQASLGLELQGLPAGYWKTEGPWTFETEGFEHLRVPVRLGGLTLPADGLVGYLLPDGPRCLFASDGAPRLLDTGAIRYTQDLQLACAGNPLALTLLMDASSRVHATTGILPRHSIALPREASQQLGLMEQVYFSVGPVLGARPAGGIAAPAMPRPSDAFGQWSWATRPDLGWRETQPADDRARFAENLALSEGWLGLRRPPNHGNAASGNPR